MLAGGASKERLHSIGDSTGAAIMQALGKKISDLEKRELISIRRFADVKELVKDEAGNIAGVIFKQNSKENNNGEYEVVKAKTVILAIGGSGGLRYNGLNTSNCDGITGDGLAMAYHAGAKLVDPGMIQYHPTGGVFPTGFSGKLISEKARSLGAILFNKNGEPLVSQGNRDDIVNNIMSEVNSGGAVEAPFNASGIWLATPLIDEIYGEGTIEKELPGLYKKYQSEGIDISKHAILISPTVHYQLGGIEIDVNGKTNIPNLFAAGEVSEGIDGANRPMGNALANVVVYGRTAGIEAAKIAHKIPFAKDLSIEHLNNFPEKEEEEYVYSK